MAKLIVNYQHDPADLQTIYLSVTTSRKPASDSWKPAYRDTIDGKRVVWAHFSERGGNKKVNLWLRDNSGDRLVSTVTL